MQKQIQDFKSCSNITNTQMKKQFIQISPKAPKLMAQIKLHKNKMPIRTVVNNIDASSYKLGESEQLRI
jgi:hypothetical protein